MELAICEQHHYAITLVKRGYQVFFLDPPNNELDDIRISDTSCRGLYHIEAPQVAKGLRFYPKSIRVSMERRWLERLEKMIGHKFSIVWLFENSRFYNMEFAGDRLKIYHQVTSTRT